MELHRLLLVTLALLIIQAGLQRWSCTGCCFHISITNYPGWCTEMELHRLLLVTLALLISRLECKDRAAQDVAVIIALLILQAGVQRWLFLVTLALLILQAGVQRWSCTGCCCHTNMTNSPGWSTEMELHRLLLSH
jgi:hypothetical protein